MHNLETSCSHMWTSVAQGYPFYWLVQYLFTCLNKEDSNSCTAIIFAVGYIMNYLLYLCMYSLLRLHWMEIGITYFSKFNRPIHDVWNGYAYVCTEQAQMPKRTLVQLTPYIIQYCTRGHRKLETRPMTFLRTLNINVYINKGIQQVYHSEAIIR